jgi:UPF0716 protein FxsA
MRLSAVFAVVALLEMVSFFWIGSQIGYGWALLIALFTALLGSYLVRRAGATVWGQLRRRLNRGEIPGRELAHGAAILVAGAFLISPGFITDATGLLLLVPAVRDFLYRRFSSRLTSRVGVFPGGHRPGAEVIDVDGWD